MANKARWVHAVHHRNGFIMVTVGPDSSTVTGSVNVDTLPRQDLRRVAAHLGLDGGMSRSNDELHASIHEFVNDRSNHDDDGRIIPNRDRKVTPTPAPAPRATVPAPSPAPNGSVDQVLDSVIRTTVRQELENAKVGVDEATVEAIIRRVVGQPKQIVVRDIPKGTVTGRTHYGFDELLIRVGTGENIAVTGGPGTGKTYASEQIAKALGRRSVTVSSKPLPQEFEILGGVAPALGKLVMGKFREIYEHGGVGIIDEWDRGHVSLGTAFNKLLANDTYDFDREGGGTETVEKHPEFSVIATLNTYGQGASLEFAGANKIDDAGLDRFTFFHMDTDEELTEQICRDKDNASADLILPIWKQARRNVENYRLKVWVTPRCAFGAQKFLLAGLDLRTSFKGRLFGRGLPADQEAKLLDGITF